MTGARGERPAAGEGRRPASDRRPRPAGQRRAHRGAGERGAAGLLVVAGGVLVVGAAVVGGALVAGATTHTRAQSAADLVALGVGSELLRRPDPCSVAAPLATANDVAVASCRVVGGGVTVVVQAPLPVVLRRFTGHEHAIATARAELVVDPDALP